MSMVLRTLFALAAVLALAVGAPAAPAMAAEEFKQIELNDKLVTSFIGAQKEVSEYHQKAGPPASDKPDPKVQADLEGIAKKNGFASYSEFDDVAFNVTMVMGGLDPQTGAFTDPIAAIKKEIEEIEKDTSIPEKDKKQMLDELAEALKNTPAMKFPGNVEVVKKHRAEIEKVLQ